MKEKTKRTLTMWGVFACFMVLLIILIIVLAGPQKVSKQIKLIQKNLYTPIKTALAKTQVKRKILSEKKLSQEVVKQAKVSESYKKSEVTEQTEAQPYEQRYQSEYPVEENPEEEEYYEPHHYCAIGLANLVYYPYWYWNSWWYWYGGFYSYWSYIGFYIGWNPWWYWTYYPGYYYGYYYPYYYSYYYPYRYYRYAYWGDTVSYRTQRTVIHKNQLEQKRPIRAYNSITQSKIFSSSTSRKISGKYQSPWGNLRKIGKASYRLNSKKVVKTPGKYQSPWGDLRSRSIKKYPSRASTGTRINPRSERLKRTSPSTTYRTPYSRSSSRYIKSRPFYRYPSRVLSKSPSRYFRTPISKSRSISRSRPISRLISRSSSHSSRSSRPPTKIRKK